MIRDETIELARQAGLLPCQGIHVGDLKAFAKLIEEREREACARLLETTDLSGLKDNPTIQSWVAEMLLAYIKVIRARGQA